MSYQHEEEVLGKAYDARLMRRLLAYLKPHRWYVAGALAALIADAATQLVPPYLVKVAIDQYIGQGDLAGLNGVAVVYLAVLLAAFSLEYTQTYMMQMIGQRIMYDMRMEIYAHLQRLDLSFYDRNPVGRLMTRVTTDVDVLNDMFTSGVVSIFGDIFTRHDIGGGNHQIRVHVEHLAYSPQPIEASGISGGFALFQDPHQLDELRTRTRQLPLAHLRGGKLRVGESQVGSHTADLIVGPARVGIGDSRCSRAFELATPGHRQRLQHGGQRFGHAGYRLAIDGEARIRPAAGSGYLGAGHVDAGANRPRARAVCRQPG